MAEYGGLKVAELKHLIKYRGIESKGLSKKHQFVDALLADDKAKSKDGSIVLNDQVVHKDQIAVSGKKRAASYSNEPNKTPKPAKMEDGNTEEQVGLSSEAQFASSSQPLHIPVDENCTLAGYQVYVDPSNGIIYDASLNQTNAANNNNKFYRIQVCTASVTIRLRA